MHTHIRSISADFEALEIRNRAVQGGLNSPKECLASVASCGADCEPKTFSPELVSSAWQQPVTSTSVDSNLTNSSHELSTMKLASAGRYHPLYPRLLLGTVLVNIFEVIGCFEFLFPIKSAGDDVCANVAVLNGGISHPNCSTAIGLRNLNVEFLQKQLDSETARATKLDEQVIFPCNLAYLFGLFYLAKSLIYLCARIRYIFVTVAVHSYSRRLRWPSSQRKLPKQRICVLMSLSEHSKELLTELMFVKISNQLMDIVCILAAPQLLERIILLAFNLVF